MSDRAQHKIRRHVRIPLHSGPAARPGLAAGFFVALLALTGSGSWAVEGEPIRIAVFDFVLDDRSAAGGVLADEPIDMENLRKSTDEARRRLADSGRYSIVGTAELADDMEAAGGVQHCNGCDAPLAQTLGADQSMVGVVTRVSRTEYTLQIVVRDTGTGEVVSNSFTGLRMGANYAWPRGVKWLMENRILTASSPQ